MNVRRPQEIQHERQEAPAGPKLSARRLQEASQNELPSGAVGRRQEPSRRAENGRLGCIDNRALRAWLMIPGPIYRASLGLGNPARAEILEGDVWGALKIEHYALLP